MKKLFLIFVMSGIAAILCALNGCGSDSTPPNDKPTASAGETQDVNASAAVTLDGSGSSDLNGNTLTYAWTQTSGTTVTLSSATAVQPTFTAGSTPQTYVFQLIVNDGTVDSDLATVQIRVWMDATKKLFVNASASAASADGSQTNPYTTIGSAITAATAGGEDVYVATGTYTENITMVEGVSLFGGYEATNWTRNITTNAATINPPDTMNSAISIASDFSTSTYINGFAITRPAYSNAILCRSESGGSGGGLTISENTINFGAAVVVADSGFKPALILISPCAGVTIEGNTISGATDSANSVAGGVIAINVESTSTATIRQNTINAGKNTSNGSGARTTGITIRETASATITRNHVNGGDGVAPASGEGSLGITSSSTGNVVIENNIVYAGNGYTAEDNVAGDSFAIGANGSGGTNIVNNTIYLGGGTGAGHAKGGIIQLSTGIINVTNNLIIQNSGVSATQQTCLYRGYITGVFQSSPFNSVLNNDCNAVSGGFVYLYLNEGDVTSYTTVSAMVTELATEGTSAANTTGNVAVDPILQTGSDYLLSSGSSLIGAGYSGSLVTLPTVDYDGNVRPTSTGYDIGADQY